MRFRVGMNTHEEQIDFGLDHLCDLAKGEFDPEDYPGAMSAVFSKVSEAIGSRSREAQMIKRDQDTFALQWIESHPEALSYDEYIEQEYGKEVSFFDLTKKQRAKRVRFLDRQEKMLPSRERELLLSREEALLLLTALYMPDEFLGDLAAAIERSQ